MDPLLPATAEAARRAEVDLAFADEDQATARGFAGEEQAPATSSTAGAPPTRVIRSIPQLLRWMGAAVLVAAAFTFMIQSWETGDDVVRYFHFLGFTGSLAVAGIATGLRMGDEKGARTFLGLAVGAVPVHFTVLGAILYSQFPWLSGFADYPGYAHFSAPDQTMALFTAALGIAVLVPVCWMAFLTFARPAARSLTAAFLIVNTALLVPTRHADVIGAMALAMVLGTLVFDRRVLAGLPALRTHEGQFVRALMAVPFVVLVARTFNLYDPSLFFFAALFASVAVLMFSVVPQAGPTRELGRMSQHLSLLPAAVAWWCTLLGINELFPMPEALALPLACLPTAGLFGAMSLRAIGGGETMRRLAALMATGGMLLQLLIFPGVASSLGCLATAILAATYGFAAEQRGIFVTGLLALGLGLLYHARYAFEIYAWSPWGTLALLGIATVFAASLIERHHLALGARWTELRGRLSTWSA